MLAIQDNFLIRLVIRCIAAYCFSGHQKGYTDELKKVLDVYKDDERFKSRNTAKNYWYYCPDGINDIFDVLLHLQNLYSAGKELIKEICIMAKLVPFMPATNNSGERSFSATRRVKSYLLTYYYYHHNLLSIILLSFNLILTTPMTHLFTGVTTSNVRIQCSNVQCSVQLAASALSSPIHEIRNVKAGLQNSADMMFS